MFEVKATTRTPPKFKNLKRPNGQGGMPAIFLIYLFPRHRASQPIIESVVVFGEIWCALPGAKWSTTVPAQGMATTCPQKPVEAAPLQAMAAIS